MRPGMPVVVTFSTFPSAEKAAEVARTLVDERLAACVTLIPSVRSIYRWNDQLCDEAETLAVIKTTEDRVAPLTARLIALHPYELPEAVALRVTAGNAPYLAWIAEATTPLADK